MTNISVTEEISVWRDVDFCQINGLTSDVAGADNQNVDAKLDGTLILKDAYLKGALIGGVRFEDSSGSGKQVIIIDKVILEGNDGTVRMFRATDEPWPGRIKLVSFEVITGTTDLTGTNLKNAQIQRNLGLPRIFRDNQDPASRGITNAYNIGDIVYDTSPSAGSTVGWICVSDDIPCGKWASFGAISSVVKE
ncbi:hypothetical protein H8E77_31000 [bacterium]|nr:hypothetical protein [bacterium]